MLNLKRPLTGFLCFLAVLMLGVATQASAASAERDRSWFTAPLSSSSSGQPAATGASKSLAAQKALIAKSHQKQAQDCANGAQGTVGHAVQMSLKIHLDINSSPAKVEEFFGMADCFSMINNIIDLSFAIPTIMSIINAAIDIVMEYIKKQVCEAITQLTNIIIEPINEAIGRLNGMIGEINDFNGMSAGLGLIGNGITSITGEMVPGLHREAKPPTNVNANPFGRGHAGFEPYPPPQLPGLSPGLTDHLPQQQQPGGAGAQQQPSSENPGLVSPREPSTPTNPSRPADGFGPKSDQIQPDDGSWYKGIGNIFK